jgi:hypothetical protein
METEKSNALPKLAAMLLSLLTVVAMLGDAVFRLAPPGPVMPEEAVHELKL